MIEGNGAKVNDEPVKSAGMMISPADLQEALKLSAGKKKHALVKLGA